MSLTTFSDIPRSVLALLLDGVEKPRGISPRLIMGEPGTIGPREKAELYAGGFIGIPDKPKIKLTPQFVRVARVLLNPRTNLTIRIWGKESICGETNIQFPGNIMQGGGVILNQIGRMYRISAFAVEATVTHLMGEAIPEPLEDDLEFELKAHLDNPVVAILFAVIDLARIRVSETKKPETILNMAFSAADVYSYMDERWLFTGFKDLITYITAIGIMPEPPSLTDTLDGLRLLAKAGLLKENRKDIYSVTKAIEPLVRLTIGQPSGVQWQRISLMDNGERFISNRMFLFADKSLMLCIAPTLKGRLYISRVRRKEITDFLAEEIMSTLTPVAEETGVPQTTAVPPSAVPKAPPAAAVPKVINRAARPVSPPPATPPPPAAAPPKVTARAVQPVPTPAVTPPPVVSPPKVTQRAAQPVPPLAAPSPQPAAFCAQCGTVIRPDSKHCSQCGAPIATAKVAPALTTCPKCNVILKPDAKFCGNCGTVISSPSIKPDFMVCPTCGQKLKPDAQFCPGCGTKL